MRTEATTHLLVVRHAQSVWNASQRWQGWADPPLSPLGLRQAAQAARRLESWLVFDAVASSDLRRARHTAELLELPVGPPSLHPGLREYDVGAWSGLQLEEIESQWPGQIDRWRRGELAATPGGEQRDAFEQRLRAALGALVDTYRGQRILVVSHGGVIRSLFRSAGGDHRHIGQLAGCWLEVDGAGTSLTGTVDLIAGPEPPSEQETGFEPLPSQR